MKSKLLVLVHALVIGASVNVAAVASPDAFAFRGVRVFDGERMLPSRDVLVRAGRIVAVEESLDLPEGVEIIDGAGKTLLPGLIDAHVHTWGEARRDALRFGVTTELDMFSDWHQLADARRQRTALAPTDQADLWSAGTLATAPGGHGTQFGGDIPTLTSPGQAAQWVAQRKREGSDYIKIIREDFSVYDDERRLPTLDAATAAAVIDAAHANGLQAVVHASAQATARQALENGADGLVHIFQDMPADDAFVRLAREREAFIVPTLTVIAGMSGEDNDVIDDPRIAPWLTEGQRQTLEVRFPGADKRGAFIDNARASVRRLHAAGVPILAGTDAPNPNTAHGASLHEELRQLTRAGLDNVAALAAATSVPADAFGLADRGRIAPGMLADLLLVNGNPAADIRATRDIAAIWKDGYRVERVRPAAPVRPNAAVVSGDLISDFEQTDIASRYGHGWEVSTDALMKGKSTAVIARVASGANGSDGALEVSGEVKAGFMFPWAGAMFFPGEKPMQPVDWSDRKELVFQVKGDGREYTAMLFSTKRSFGAPPSQTFVAGAEWSEIRLPLAGFKGAELAGVTGLAFTAGTPHGEFRFALDDVAVR